MDLTTYIITFEISDAIRRANFKQKLKEVSGNYCPIHEYAWAIRAEKTASELRDSLKVHLVTTDRLFVIRTGTAAAWSNPYGEKNSEWLKKYL